MNTLTETIPADTLTKLLATDNWLVRQSVSGFRNRLLFIELGADLCVVKFYADELSFSQERDGIQLAARSGLRVPTIFGEDDVRNILVLEYIKGKPLRHFCLDSTRLIQFARTLASIHRVTITGLLSTHCYQSELEHFEQNIMSSLFLSMLEKQLCYSAIQKIAPFFRRETDELCFIHNDIHPGNVFIEEGTNSIVMLDFEKSHKGLSQLDIAKTIWRICGMDSNNVSTFLTHYYNSGSSLQEKHYGINCCLLYQFLGSVSYYALEGHANNYPYKNEAIFYIQHILQ